jgi:hypothetical protein
MILFEQVDSKSLAANVIGNPSERDVVVYLPPSYHTSQQHYPTVYLLHNFYSRARFWAFGPSLDFGALHRPIQDVLDDAIAGGLLPELIVVMPDGWSKWGCSMWVDSAVNGNFEQFVAHEVVAFADSRFRTLPAPASRGIAGTGAGGFGAWHIGTRNPGVFGTIAMLSADSYFDFKARSRFYTYFNHTFPNPLVGPARGDMASWFCYSFASAFTPNPARPPYYCDFPVEYPSGKLVDELWARWLEFDPILNYQERLENLMMLRGILLDVGCRDEHGGHYGQRILSRRLTKAAIVHEAREHEGSHSDQLYVRLPLVLNRMLQTLDFTT